MACYSARNIPSSKQRRAEFCVISVSFLSSVEWTLLGEGDAFARKFRAMLSSTL